MKRYAVSVFWGLVAIVTAAAVIERAVQFLVRVSAIVG